MINDSLIYRAYKVKFVVSLTSPLFIMLLKLYIYTSAYYQCDSQQWDPTCTMFLIWC